MKIRKSKELPTVSRSLNAELLFESDETAVPATVDLLFGAVDPEAVTWTIKAPEGPPVAWTIGRQLVREITSSPVNGEPVGEGDVRGVVEQTPKGETVNLTFESPDGIAHLRVAADGVREFLRETILLRSDEFAQQYCRLQIAAGFKAYLQNPPEDLLS